MSSQIRCIIVDDESLSRRGIEIRLARARDFTIVAQCANGREALAAIRASKPDLVFLDVQMPGMSGFDVISQVPRESLPLIVFCTAFDQYAVAAFEARAVDYLLKPIDDQRFAATLDHVREHMKTRDAAAQRDQLLGVMAELTGSGDLVFEDAVARGREASRSRHADILPIRQGRETARVPARSIEWIDAAGDYMCIHAGGRTHILRGTMKELEEILDPTLFQRVHRSTIVNLQRVKSMRSHMNGEYFLTLDSGHELKLSRTYRDKVDFLLKGSRAS
jgi:two-component system LytT family response regulator